MYERYFGFSEEPFSLFPDPTFLYFGRQHRVAYSLMEYGILKQSGFTVITGDIGCGKTTLVRRLIDDLGGQVTLGVIINTHPRINNLLEWVSLAFGLDCEAKGQVEMYRLLMDFLLRENACNRRTVLVIDEAQNLDAANIEEVRTLSNIQGAKHQILQVILVGQPELKATLLRPELRQFSQRVLSHYELKPLSEAETVTYIHHRLQCAGGHPELFNQEACRLIHFHARGVPRLINLLCGTTLLYAFAEDAKFIGVELVMAVLDEGAAGLCMGTPTPEGVPVQVTEAPATVLTPQGQQNSLIPEATTKPRWSKFNIDDARELFTHIRRDKS
jgi:general secretion pathway protein A